MAQTFSLREAFEGAATGARATMAVDAYRREKEKGKTVEDLTGKSLSGDQQALKQLMGVDARQGVLLMEYLNKADERSKQNLRDRNDALAKAVTYVMQAPSEEERAERWDASVTHLVENQGMEALRQHIGQYSPETAQIALTNAMSLDQLVGDSEKGEIKPGVDKNNNPIYTVIYPQSGTSKEVTGPGRRRDPAATKDNRTALQRNVPFVAEKMKISEREATRLLTASKSKSPQQVYTDMYGRALSATFGDKDEAKNVAREVMQQIFGEKWEEGLPGKGKGGSIKDYLDKQRY